MKSRGIIDFYLPFRLAFHIKLLLGSVFVTLFFTLIWKGRLVDESFWMMYGIVVVQMEIFMAIALKIFKKDEAKYGKSYRNTIILKLLRFYAIVLVLAAIILFITIFISMMLSHQTFDDVIQHFVQRELKGFLISMLIGMSLGALIFFFTEWNHSLKREQKLREEKLIFQYETLKNQVNPHFLFNSLNTLSSLVSQDADLSEKFINRLSTIYRYILENRDVDFINLSREIEFVENYFFLQKIRDDGKIELELPPKELDQYEILPISVQLLVENALKHNAATKESPLKIKISIEDDLLVVTNTLKPKMQLGHSSKLGLKNLGERVSLVMNKKISIEPTQDSYTVKIPLKRI